MTSDQVVSALGDDATVGGVPIGAFALERPMEEMEFDERVSALAEVMKNAGLIPPFAHKDAVTTMEDVTQTENPGYFLDNIYTID